MLFIELIWTLRYINTTTLQNKGFWPDLCTIRNHEGYIKQTKLISKVSYANILQIFFFTASKRFCIKIILDSIFVDSKWWHGNVCGQIASGVRRIFFMENCRHVRSTCALDRLIYKILNFSFFLCTFYHILSPFKIQMFGPSYQ